MQEITLTSNSHQLFNFFTWKIKIINFKDSDFCKLLRLCAISALQISKKHFATFDFFVKMKLVLTVWVSTSLSKFGYCKSCNLLQPSLTYLQVDRSLEWLQYIQLTLKAQLSAQSSFFARVDDSGRRLLSKYLQSLLPIPL